ncbi:hypothetical protein LAZ67_11001126 [Cordylochernes scorpioides]|uniref:Reverse transcriptase Ty1/copia-type domain-containing protein n=1 Tax=Cordylochernes scorpioides TaxID=51811 RepID=A0ABY6KY94_9ARAC|nr:hypothetical protein LAZ67_11001126 [Cordylochernes scorpioides]
MIDLALDLKRWHVTWQHNTTTTPKRCHLEGTVIVTDMLHEISRVRRRPIEQSSESFWWFRLWAQECANKIAFSKNISKMSSLYQIEKLNSENYETWKMQMKMILIHSELWDYANSIRIKPETEVESAEWDKNDQKALATIVLSLSPSEIIHVKRCKTSAEAWKLLNEVHQPKGPATKVFLTKQLILLKMKPNERMQDYLNKFSSLADNLPESYEGFRTAIETRDKLPNFETLKVKMLEEAIRQTELNDTTDSEEKVFLELSRIRNEVIEIDVSPQKDPFVKEIPLVEEKGSTSKIESRTEIESESDLEMSDLVDEPSENEVIISRRGRGRPRYIRTGKPGRPRKEYPTANLSTQELLEAKYLPDPKDAEEALSGRDSYFWKKAMEEEFDSLIENKTWELVHPPKNRNIIGTKWVFKTKCNSDGSVERHKARLVAKGYSQQYGIDYEETFAPVVRQSTIRMFLALAVEYNLILHQMDVQSAYLNGEIKEEIFMTQPENFVSRKYPEKVCRLKKAIYGLKQAGIVWHEKLDTELKNLGLKQLQSDNCVYIKHDEGILLVAIYVDDLIIAAEREDALKSFKESMKRIFKIKDLGVNKNFIYRSVDKARYSLAVSALGQFSNDPRRQHWNAAKSVLRYLKGTSCLRITYRKSNEALHGYADADWGGNLVDRKSHTGIIYFLARGPIAWESKKQQTVTLSSTESEYIALCEAGKEAVYLRALLDEMGFGELLNGPTVLKTDNQGAQQLARNPVYHARTKHIDIKWHFIRSICSDGLVEVVHTPTQENVADILTKGLPRSVMKKTEDLWRVRELAWKIAGFMNTSDNLILALGVKWPAKITKVPTHITHYREPIRDIFKPESPKLTSQEPVLAPLPPAELPQESSGEEQQAPRKLPMSYQHHWCFVQLNLPKKFKLASSISHIHVKCNSTCVRSVVMKSNREFENRAAIIVALRAGRSPKEIVDFLKLPKTTIYRVKKQFDEADSNKEGIATRKKHSRRSDRVRGEEFVKNVKEKIDGNPGKSMRAIAKEMDVGSMTIVRTIHEDLGLKFYALRKGQLLTENMKNNRKGKAAALLNNLKHDSFGMLRFFSDEKNFDVDQKVNPRNDRWICKDPSEIPVVMHTKFPASVMVLGVISSEGDVIPPHFFEKGLRMNADTYINVLETVVKPWMDMVAAGRNHIHVKCNSTCVRSVVMKSNREFENRAAIIVALRAERSPKEIVDFLKLPKTTIYRVKKQFDEADSNKEGIATRKKHSRRSDRVRGEEFVKNFKEKIDGNPGKSMRAIAKEMDVGSMTIVRTIHEDLDLKSYALRKGQLLTENMKNNRKGKAAALLNNLKHDSFGMLRFFSDEKNFDVDQKVNPRNDRWICKDPSEIPVVMHTKFPASVMVLGVISSEGDVMPPHFFEKGLRMNADTYINVLETVGWTWWPQEGNPAGVPQSPGLLTFLILSSQDLKQKKFSKNSAGIQLQMSRDERILQRKLSYQKRRIDGFIESVDSIIEAGETIRLEIMGEELKEIKEKIEKLYDELFSLDEVDIDKESEACDSSMNKIGSLRANCNDSHVLLATARIKIKNGLGKLCTCRALLDSGSQVTMITKGCCERLGLVQMKSDRMIIGVGNTPVQHSSSTTRRIIAWCLRFITNCRVSLKKREIGTLSKKELENAVIKIIGWIQKDEFGEEMQDLRNTGHASRKSRILQLNPFIDATGMLRTEVLSLGLKYRPPTTPDIPRIISGVEPAISSLSHTAQYDIRSSIAHILRKPTPSQSQSLALITVQPDIFNNTSETALITVQPDIFNSTSETALITVQPDIFNSTSETALITVQPYIFNNTSETALITVQPDIFNRTSETALITVQPDIFNSTSETALITVQPDIFNRTSETALITVQPDIFNNTCEVFSE